MALVDRIRQTAVGLSRTLGEVVREGLEAYRPTPPERPPIVTSAPSDILKAAAPGIGGALSKKRDQPAGAEFDPLNAYGRITNDAAMSDLHPGTLGTPMQTLERLARLSVPAAVINHILDELSEFCEPQANAYSYGLAIELDDATKKMTKPQEKRRDEIMKFLMNAGAPYQDGGLEGFVRRTMRNSLTLDAFAAEVLRNRAGQPIGLMAYDAKTIRKREPRDDWMTTGRWGEDPGYVQWIDTRVWAEWDGEDFIYGIRRPRTDIHAFGYGFPELDELVTVLVNFARAENYNAINFTSGIHASHVLAIMSSMEPESFAAHRRMFEANLAAPGQKRRLPMLQLDPELKEDVKAISLGNTNAEMEYTNWINYHIKLICAIYGVDPAAAVNMLFGNEGQTNSLASASPSEKLLNSKAHGIRIKLRWLARWLTRVVKMFDPEMHAEFKGFDAVTEQEKVELDIKRLGGFMTVNEIRKQYELEPIEGAAGDTIANPYVSQAQSMDAMNKQQEQEQGGGGGGGFGDGGEDAFGGMDDASLMLSLRRDPYLRRGGNIDQISKAAVAPMQEALRRGLVKPPLNWRPGVKWGVAEGPSDEPRVISLEVKL